MFEEIKNHNELVKAQIFSGFANTEELVEKGHQVGEIKVGSDGIKRVWTQLSNGKYDWRRVKHTKGEENEQGDEKQKPNDEKEQSEKVGKENKSNSEKSQNRKIDKKILDYLINGKSEDVIKKKLVAAGASEEKIKELLERGKKLFERYKNAEKLLSKTKYPFKDMAERFIHPWNAKVDLEIKNILTADSDNEFLIIEDSNGRKWHYNSGYNILLLIYNIISIVLFF